jgi:hypothetical protein
MSSSLRPAAMTRADRGSARQARRVRDPIIRVDATARQVGAE